MAGTFNVLDYGAKGDGVTLDTAAIQAALDAAYAAGGGVVYIPQGVYIVHSMSGDASDGALQIRDNVTLEGAGMGLSVLKVRDGETSKITGVVRTPSGEVTHDVVIRDLTIDGNHQKNSGEIDGFFCGVTPGSADYDYNILVERVEIKNVSRYAFDPHEQTKNLTIRDSVAHDNLGDGFTIDFCFDTVLENNVAYNNGRYGFNIVTSSHDILLKNNIAYGNAANGISVQKGSEDRPFIYDVLIEGGKVYNNAKYGIEIKLSERVTVQGVEIYGNKSGGISIFGAQNNLISGNNIHDNGSYGVRVREYDDREGVQGTYKIWAATGNTITGNVISGQSTAVQQVVDSSLNNAAYNNTGDGVVKGIGLSPLDEPSGSQNTTYVGYLGTAPPSTPGDSGPGQPAEDPPADPSAPATPNDPPTVDPDPADPQTPTSPGPVDPGSHPSNPDHTPLDPPADGSSNPGPSDPGPSSPGSGPTQPNSPDDAGEIGAGDQGDGGSDSVEPSPVDPDPPEPDPSIPTEPVEPPAEMLLAAYEALLWRAPTGAEKLMLESLGRAVEAGPASFSAALDQLVQRADDTTAVAILSYAFFTGAAPTERGFEYLLDPEGPNPNSLNSAYYQAFSMENRFINFAVNLGVVGEGRAQFADLYGGLTLRQATAAAYREIFGATASEAKLDALLGASFNVGGSTFTRADYLASYGGDGLEGLGTKAAMVGFLLAEAAKADVGVYAKASNAYLMDLADGADFGVDLVGVYGQADFALTG